MANSSFGGPNLELSSSKKRNMKSSSIALSESENNSSMIYSSISQPHPDLAILIDLGTLFSVLLTLYFYLVDVFKIDVSRRLVCICRYIFEANFFEIKANISYVVMILSSLSALLILLILAENIFSYHRRAILRQTQADHQKHDYTYPIIFDALSKNQLSSFLLV